MQSPKYALLAIGLLTAGCEVSQQAVFVNLDALAPRPPVGTTPPVSSHRPQSLPGSTFSSTERPGAVIDLSGNKDRKERVKSVLQSSRDETQRDLVARLRAAYYRRIQHLEREKLAELQPEYRDQIAAAYSRIWNIFEPYATKRGPMVARLALLAGFPDLDPDSKNEPVNAGGAVKARFAEAKQLRSSIAALDIEFRNQVQNMVGEPDQAYAERLTQMRIWIEEERAKADEEALKEAVSQVQQEEQDLKTELDKTATLNLEPEPSRTIAVPGVSPAGGIPEVPGMSAIERTEAAKRELKNDLAIWVAHNGYRLVPSASMGRDATEEFQAWRQSLHDGP